MFRFRNPLIILSVTALVAIIASCGGSEYRKQEMYYLVAPNVKLPFWQTARAGLLRAAAEIGVGVEIVGPDTYDPQAQKEEFEKAVAAQPAGILISVADPELMNGPINAAVEKGINVVTINADAPDSQRRFFVGTDNYSVGVQAAEFLADQLQRAGTVIVFTIEGQVNMEDRLRGYNDVFATYPAIKVIETVNIKGNAAAAFDRTKELLAKGINRMDAFVCLEEVSCPEIAEVLSRGGVTDKLVVGMDTDQRTLEWIQQGLIKATIAQKPFTMAYTGLRMLADLTKYPPQRYQASGSLATGPSFVDTGATLVTRDNVSQYLRELEASGIDIASPTE